MYTGVFNLIILLTDPPQSNCLSSSSSCLSLRLDKVLHFCFLIKASCSPEVMEESWAQWSAFCHSLSWDTQILQPGILWVSGRRTASFLWELLLSGCLLLSKPIYVNPIMARPWFSPAPTAVQVERGLQDRWGAGVPLGRGMLGLGCRADPGASWARKKEGMCFPKQASADQLSSVEDWVFITVVFHIPKKKKRRKASQGFEMWNMQLF